MNYQLQTGERRISEPSTVCFNNEPFKTSILPPQNLRPGAMWAYERSSHVVPVRIPTVWGTQVQVAEQRGHWLVRAVYRGWITTHPLDPKTMKKEGFKPRYMGYNP